MSSVAVQASFNSGEWSPALFARVDIAKYRSGAALLKNWYVDYRGGASTRPGAKYVIQALNSSQPVRVIGFQTSSLVGYAIELGHFYARFIFQGAPVVEPTFAITGATNANPCVLTIPGNNYVAGNVIFVSGVGGMTQLNGRYFSVFSVVGSAVTLTDLSGSNIDSTLYGAYTSGGTSARVYTINTPWASADLQGLKVTQLINTMVICHPSYPPYILTEVSPTNWTITPVVIGTSAGTPTGLGFTTSLASGSVTYAYCVTSVDGNGQESARSNIFSIGTLQDMRVTNGSIQLTWTAVPGAVSYNVYKTTVSYLGVVPAGQILGYIGNTTTAAFVDTNIAPDYTQTPPIVQNPFSTSNLGVSSVQVSAFGTYTSVPGVTFSAGTLTATGFAVLVVVAAGVGTGGSGYAVNDRCTFGNGVTLIVATVAAGVVTSWTILYNGNISTGSTPTNPVAQVSTSGSGSGASANLTWGVGQVVITYAGQYATAPTITFSSGAAAATALLAPSASKNPSVPGFFQQRLIFGGSTGQPQTIYGSQSGNYFNFNVSFPPRADDSIEGTLVSGILNTVKSIVSSTAGMLVLTDNATFLVNGGSSGSAITPAAIVANAQSYVGANDMPPIVANYDILFVQEKGASVRDLSYNIYFNVFTGSDVSILSSHLFYGFQLLQWCWAEEPFKMVWAVRNDGTMLTLTFLKEQDFIGWAQQTTLGAYTSVCKVTETSTGGIIVDAIYTVVQLTVGGNTVKYIERIADRIFTNGVTDAWCVDHGIQYVGSPATSFTGAEHLRGLTVTGLADGVVIPPFVMPLTGFFTLGTPASKVTVGTGFDCRLQTLPLEIGEPSVQGKVKSIPFVDIRVKDTLGLAIGSSFFTTVAMKDLVIGNISSTLTGQPIQQIAGLVTGDARTFLDKTYTVPGQYCIEQTQPLPATVLGVFPAIVQGDDI